MHATKLRKTKYDDHNRHYFDKAHGEPELPWRKWVRENLPRGPEGFVFEDVDGVAVLFDPRTHTNRAFMLLEFKWWGVALDRSQIETLRMIDELLRAGDPRRELYKGVFTVEWHRRDEFVRINYQQPLSHDRFRQFLLFQVNLPSYFG